MSIDVYKQIPVMESNKFLLREIEDADAEDLLKVYSDQAAVPLFNSENEMIATKVIPIAKERIQALEHMGFGLSEESVMGHDGTKYGSYYVLEM